MRSSSSSNNKDFNMFVLERGVAVDRRDDYIAEIEVVFGNDSDKLPEGQGWELVEKSPSGKSANLNKVSRRRRRPLASPWVASGCSRSTAVVVVALSGVPPHVCFFLTLYAHGRLHVREREYRSSCQHSLRVFPCSSGQVRRGSEGSRLYLPRGGFEVGRSVVKGPTVCEPVSLWPVTYRRWQRLPFTRCLRGM